VLDQQRNDASPGPIYELRTSEATGKQVLSRYRTQPSPVFAKSERTLRDEHIEVINVGPEYTLDSLFGKQVRSRHRTAGTPSFGTSKRPTTSGEHNHGHDGVLLIHPKPDLLRRTPPSISFASAPWRLEEHSSELVISPSPAEYSLPGSVSEKQIESTKATALGFSMTGRDFTEERRPQTPGPGTYNVALHHRTNRSRSTNFGGSKEQQAKARAEANKLRDKTKKVDRWVNPNDDEEEQLVELPPSVGPQFNSRYRSTPSSSFGRPPGTPQTEIRKSTRDRPHTAPAHGRSGSGVSGEGDMAESGGDDGGLSLAERYDNFLRRVSSKEKSVPGAKFGTGERLANESREELGPGPQTYDPTSVHKGVLQTSSKRAVLGTKFGRAPSKKQREKTSETLGPGPGAYDAEKMARSVALTKAKNAPNVKFGRSERSTTTLRSRKTPGPGPTTYEPEPSIGPQVLSTKSSSLSKSFGKRIEPNDPSARQPGPQSYDPQFNHKRRVTSNVKFGTSERPLHGNSALKGMSPSPAHYQVPGAFGKQVVSRYRSSTGKSFGAR